MRTIRSSRLGKTGAAAVLTLSGLSSRPAHRFRTNLRPFT
jgi:hypothetical protein